MTGRRVWGTVAIVMGAAFVTWLYLSYSPESYPYPRCPFRSLTGLLCPGCGSQRALHALLHGNLAQAWSLNAALPVGLALLPVYACAEWGRRRFHRLHRALCSPTAAYVLVGAIVLWWVGRNVF